MDNLQFNLEDSPLLSIQSLSIIDVSSDSGEAFVVQSSSLPDIEERFRVSGPRSDMMTAFVGATSATLFASEPEDPVVTEIIDTAGTQIERQMMDIIEEHQFSRESSSTSFIDTELEDSPMSPYDTAEPMGVPVNSYGRPSAAILPTPRNTTQAPAAIIRPIATNPTNFTANNLNFQAQQLVDHGHQQTHRVLNGIHTDGVNPNSAFTPISNNLPMYNNAPLMIQIPPHEGSLHIPRLRGGPNRVPNHHFPFQVGHSTNLLLLLLQERQMYRLLPTVMRNVAGFCDWCGKCYNLIALETGGVPRRCRLRWGNSQGQGCEVTRLHRWVRGCTVLFQRCGTVAASWVLRTCCARMRKRTTDAAERHKTCLD